jgi:hypothetical protein
MIVQIYSSNKNQAEPEAKNFVKGITGQLAISFWNEYLFFPTFAPEQLIEGNENVPFFFYLI